MTAVTRDEVWEMFREVARRFEETDRQLSQRFQETDLKFKETDRKFKETDQLLKTVSKQIGDLGNRLGDFVQEMVRPALVRLFRERGIEVHEVHPNIYVERGDEAIEIDLMVVNDQEAIAVECKSQLTIDDVNDHLQRLGKIKRLLPKYSDVHLMGAVAAMVMTDDVARYAYRRGLYVLAQSGDTILVRNDAKFSPKTW